MAFDPIIAAWRAVNPTVPVPQRLIDSARSNTDESEAESMQRTEEAKQRKLEANRQRRRIGPMPRRAPNVQAEL